MQVWRLSGLIGLSLALTAAPAQARSLAQIKASGTLYVANSMDTGQFYFLDQNKKPSGFEVEIAQAIAKEMGLKAEFVVIPWAGLLLELNRQPAKIDMVAASHTITSTRLKQVEFSIPHYCTGGVIITYKGGPLTSKELAGHDVAVEPNTTYQSFVKKHPSHLIPHVVDDVTKAVIDKKTSVGITDFFFVVEALKKNPDKGLVMSSLLWKEYIGMAFAKGNTELRDAVNVALKKVVANGTYDQLSNKYFGKSIRCK